MSNKILEKVDLINSINLFRMSSIDNDCFSYGFTHQFKSEYDFILNIRIGDFLIQFCYFTNDISELHISDYEQNKVVITEGELLIDNIISRLFKNLFEEKKEQK